MDITDKFEQLQQIQGYKSYFGLTSKGMCIQCQNFTYDNPEVRKLLLQFIELKKSLKESGSMKNLQGLTIYGKESTILTFFTGKTGQRILLSLFLEPNTDIDKAKFQAFSLFETE